MVTIIRIIDQPDDAEYQDKVKMFLRGIGRAAVRRMKRPFLTVDDHAKAEELLIKAVNTGIKAELVPSDK